MATTHHLSQSAYEKALADSAKRPPSPWAIDTVDYDDDKNAILLRLPGGVGLVVPLAFIGELASVMPADLRKIYLSPSGETLCLDEADVHISTHGLIRDVFAQLPREMLASRLGTLGGSRSSDAKKLTSAANGKKGGRPRKSVPSGARVQLA